MSHGWYTCDFCGKHYHEAESTSGDCPNNHVISGGIVRVSEKAITRAEARQAVEDRVLPDFVIKAFNQLIADQGKSVRIVISQDKAMLKVLEIAEEMGYHYSRQDIYNNKWMDVEDYYRKAGWHVEYYKPPYYDTSGAEFIFK